MAFRVIHDDVPASASLNELSHLAERLFWRLLSQTDSWGRLPGDIDKIRAIAIPRLDVTDPDLTAALQELTDVARIMLYTADGQTICQLVEFDENQRNLAKLKRSPSRYPAPSEGALAAASENLLQKRRSAKTELDPTRRDGPRAGLGVAPAREASDEMEGLQVDQVVRSSLASGGLPTSDGGFAKRPAGDMSLPLLDLGELAGRLRGYDDGTAHLLRVWQRRGCGEREFAIAAESLVRRRASDKTPLASEARFFCSELQRLLSERQGAVA